MSDPVSVAGTAAGIVSLGIQVCGGVIKYVEAVRSRSDDLTSIEQQSTSLKNALHSIESSLSKVEANTSLKDSTKPVTKCLLDANTKLKALQDFVVELAGCSTTSIGFKEKAKSGWNKLSYPFRRSKIEQLQTCLAQATNSLQLTAKALGLNLTNEIFKTLHEVHTDSQQIRTDIQHLRAEATGSGVLLQDVQSRLPELQDSMNTAASTVSLRVDSLSTQAVSLHTESQKSIAEVQTTLNMVLESSSRMEQTFQQLALGDPMGQGHVPALTMRRIISKPSTMRTVCDELERCERVAQAENPTSSKSSGICSCRRRQIRRRWQYRVGSFDLFQDNADFVEHMPHCPISKINTGKSQRLLGLRYHGLVNMIGRALEVSLGITTGAGGAGIAPYIRYYDMVDERSAPAFMVMECLRYAVEFCRDDEHDGVQLLLSVVLQKMKSLFNSRRASPTSVNKFNQNLLHEYLSISYSPYDRSMSDATRKTFLKLSKFLVACGVPLHAYDDQGELPVGHMLQEVNVLLRSEVLDIIYPDSVAEHPIILQNKNLGLDRWVEMQLMKNPRIASGYCCGPLSQAILANDKDEVIRLVENQPSMLEEVNSLERTPLHLSINTPHLPLISQACPKPVLNRQSNDGRSALSLLVESDAESHRECAGSCNCDTSLALLEADCAIIPELLFAQDRPGWYSHFGSLSYRFKTSLAFHLYDRRHRLKQLALDKLSYAEAGTLGLHTSSTLDVQAKLVEKMLRKKEVAVEPALTTGFERFEGHVGGLLLDASIYQFLECPEDAAIFWELGFDFTSVGPKKHVMGSAPKLPYMKWLLNHGAELKDWLHRMDYDLLCLDFGTAKTDINQFVIGRMVGAKLGGDGSDAELQIDIAHEMIAETMEAGITGTDRCSCSVQGRTSFHAFLEGFLERRICDIQIQVYPISVRISVGLSWLFQVLEGHDIKQSHHHEAIQLATFEALGIRHVCHGRGFEFEGEPLSQEETVEILEEERAVLSLLDELVTEFQALLRDLLEQSEDIGDKTQDDDDADNLRDNSKGPSGSSSDDDPNDDDWEDVDVDLDGMTPMDIFWDIWGQRMGEVLAEIEGNNLSDAERLAAENIGIAWVSTPPSPEPEEDELDEFDDETVEYWIRKIEEIE